MSRLHQDNGAPCVDRKICLATVSYDRPDDGYTFSIASSREALHAAGIGTAYYLLHGNCHVDDARNRIIQEFLLSDCTELVFLDADVSWRVKDLVKLCSYEHDVIGAVYPFKRPDKSQEMPVRMKPHAVLSDGLLEVEGLPTGFLRIRRHVIEELISDCEFFNGNNGHETMTPILFERTLIDGTRWGGDLDFCNRWRAKGGTIMCDPEIILGHSTKIIFEDSLAAFTRRYTSQTLRHVADKIRAGTWTVEDLCEARRYDDNQFGTHEDTLAIAVGFAKKADGPIIEAGSGLSTILMAAATDQTVYCLEHHHVYAAKLRQMAAEAGISNVGLCLCDIKDGWYDLEGKTLPDAFALGLNDGPARMVGSRKGFMTHFGDRVDTIICDDVDDQSYRKYVEKWANAKGMITTIIPPRTAILRSKTWQQPVTLSTAV